MASLARANISIHPQGVTITSGNYHASLSHHEWWFASTTSQTNVIHLPLQKKCDRLSLALGLVIRSSTKEVDVTLWEVAVRAIEGIPEPQIDVITQWEPVVKEPAAPMIKTTPAMIHAFMRTASSRNLQGLRVFEALMPVADLIDFEGNTSAALLGGLSDAVIKTTGRYIQRNILNTSISRYIPQDVKIAVAHRDGGRCTHRAVNGVRCNRTDRMHYDHRWIPFHLGGPQDPWNLCLLCDDHNTTKSGKWFWEGI